MTRLRWTVFCFVLLGCGVGGGNGGNGGNGGGAPDCPGIAHRFGGPQPEGAIICDTDKATVLICKAGQWQKAGVSCADSTTVDIAGVVHPCECNTDYGRWSATCGYTSNNDCHLTIYAGGGTPCAGKPAGPVCGGDNWLYDCDGAGNANGNVYCRYGCTDGACAGNDPCVNATRAPLGYGTYCGSALTTPDSSDALFQVVTADENTLYHCSGYSTQSTTPCPNGCQSSSGGDACR